MLTYHSLNVLKGNMPLVVQILETTNMIGSKCPFNTSTLIDAEYVDWTRISK